MRDERIEVKRCFVVSEKAKELRNLDGRAFQMRLIEIEKIYREKAESELDKLISPDWPPRLKKYNELRGTLKIVQLMI